MTVESQLKEFVASYEATKKSVQWVVQHFVGASAHEPALYASPVSLPESTCGRVSVRHRWVEGSLPVVGLRQSFVRGVAPVNARLREPRLVHELWEQKRGMWMSDSPEELNQAAEELARAQPRGRVLVGGLGLGCMAKMVAALDDVESVTVVERTADIVALCSDQEAGYGVVVADIRAVLQAPGGEAFDAYLLDTWQGTSESTWWSCVLPLRRSIARRHAALGAPRPVVSCWAEDIMLAQVVGQVLRSAAHWRYGGGAVPAERTPEAALGWLRAIGTPEWEARYGAAVDAGARR